MKSKANQSNSFVRIVSIPLRALCKARDFYVKSMIGYADRMSYGTAMAVPGASHVSGLPRSFSAAVPYSDEDVREIARATRAELRSGPRPGPPRSSSVAMGRIDEDRPCCYFGEDDHYFTKFNYSKNEIKYPRSKSHAVIPRRRLQPL